MAVEAMRSLQPASPYSGDDMSCGAVEEAAYAGLRSMERLIAILGRGGTTGTAKPADDERNRDRVAEDRRDDGDDCNSGSNSSKGKAASPAGASVEGRGNNEIDCLAVADAAVTKFRKFISLLDRTRTTGHARFRRAPVHHHHNQQQLTNSGSRNQGRRVDVDVPVKREAEEEVQVVKALGPPPPAPPSDPTAGAVRVYCPKPIQRLPPLPYAHHHTNIHHHPSRSAFGPPPRASEAAVNGPHASSSLMAGGSTTSSSAFQAMPRSGPAPPSSSAAGGVVPGRPPLAAAATPSSGASASPSMLSLKRKCCESSVSEEAGLSVSAGKCASGPHSAGARCHCSKRRKSRLRRVVRVPAISVKAADIPSDDFSWRKYGQKPIKGSPYPRGYYKCSSVRGCPARKHVERAVDDPTMLVVTYEGDHNHGHSHSNLTPHSRPAATCTADANGITASNGSKATAVTIAIAGVKPEPVAAVTTTPVAVNGSVSAVDAPNSRPAVVDSKHQL